jgi:hypothetical protein
LSIFKSGAIKITSTNFTRCFVHGVPQAANVFVSGGGLHVQASDSLSLRNCSMSGCAIQDAFSSFLQSGGGAFGTQNVSSVEVSDSSFYGNADSSSTGIIFMQQLRRSIGMYVVFNRSVVRAQPSSTPALNISCGSRCPVFQQRRMHIRFQESNLSSYDEANSEPYSSAMIMSLPISSEVFSEKSFLECKFNFNDDIAVLASSVRQAVTFTCDYCPKPFEIALTSNTLSLSLFRNVTNIGINLCQATLLNSSRQCPYGLDSCSTSVNVSAGLWANFSSGGVLSTASNCPPSYCGCKNIASYREPSCKLEPPLSPWYERSLQLNDNLCSFNRSGVLCGACKPGFTQSLDGYSCIHNDVCLQNVRWTWAVTLVGYFIYSIYAVLSSRYSSDDGLIQCAVFYGQMSSFVETSMFRVGSQNSSPEWFSRVLQFESITSLYSQTCYGTDIGAYSFTALQLCGPAIVLCFALLIAFLIKLFQPSLKRHSVDFDVSILATISNVIVLVFSSVTTVAFKLLTCSTIKSGGSSEDVIFIDGSVKCYNESRDAVIAGIVCLTLFPFLFAAALSSNRLPPQVCDAYDTF